MLRPPAAWAFVTLAFACIATPAAAQQRYEGIAYPASGGPVVYREIHWLYRDGTVPARLVQYACPDGRVFGRKRMREVPSATAPEFDFVDARTGYREGVRTRDGVREVYWQADGHSAPKSAPWSAPAGTVVDAGFDAFVRTRWSDIDARGIAVPFLIPSRLDTLGFRIRDAGTVHEAGRTVRRLRMGLSGLLGMALPEVELAYDAADRRLLRFKGPGTVRDARGHMQSLRVEFPEPPTTRGVTRAAIDAALAAPLVTSCTS